MIYLDSNSTTFLDPRVAKAMSEYLNMSLGNPSSIHHFGQKAKGLLQEATAKVATLLGVMPAEICFTSGATEALNMAIKSISPSCHIITSSLEHIAVLAAVEEREKQGCQVTYLDPMFHQGAITARQIEEALQPNTGLIVLTAANNETGIKTDIVQIASLAEELKIPLLIDAVALMGKEPLVIPRGVSALCISGHKFHGPAGAGVLIVRKSFPLHPLLLGGSQQLERRAGTENLIGIVGLAKALEVMHAELDTSTAHMCELQTHFESSLTKKLSDLIIHGYDQERVGNTSNIAFSGVDGETLLMSLDLKGLAVGYGSACSSGVMQSSHVLRQMGVPTDVSRSSLRFSWCKNTTVQEIDRAVDLIVSCVTRLRSFVM